MMDGKRLPFPWVRRPRLSPPSYKAGDRVRRLWGVVRPCGDNRWYNELPTCCLSRFYTVEKIIFYEGRETYPSSYMWLARGYQVMFKEMQGIYYWADRFVKADFTGWVAPASDLTKINFNFYKVGVDYSQLWTMPCWACGRLRPWRLWEDEFGPPCAACWVWPANAKEAAMKKCQIIKGLVEFLRNIDIIAPGKKVRPIGPAVFPVKHEGDDSVFAPPLDPQKEYLVKDFLRGDSSQVLLHGSLGSYWVNYLKAV